MSKLISRGITLGLTLMRSKTVKVMVMTLAIGAMTLGISLPAFAQVSTSSIGSAIDDVGDTIWDILLDIILSKVFLIVIGVVLVAFLLRFAINWARGGGRRA